MSKTWFTSDLHFGHVNILTYTPQRRVYLGLSDTDTVTEMNEAIVDLWNTQVAPDDTVWVVGDVAMGKVHDNIEYVRQLNGALYLILGNHDRPHPIATRDFDKRRAWLKEYADVGFRQQTFDERMIFDGIEARVCHFPYYGDHTMDRYNAEDIARYVPVDDGRPLVHGHVHDMWKTNGAQYNLGIDAWDGVFQDAEAIGAYFRSIGYTA